MSEQDNKKRNIFNEILIGGLLEFGQLDMLDIHLLIEDLVTSGIVMKDEVKWNYIGTTSKRKRSRSDDGIHTFDILTGVSVEGIWNECGPEIRAFYRELNPNHFEFRKAKFVLYGTTELLRSANILLISDDEYEYTTLQKYGFANIDRFKSLIRADKYFKEHPEDLNRYHIIINGSQVLKQRQRNGDDIELNWMITSKAYQKEVTVVDLCPTVIKGRNFYSAGFSISEKYNCYRVSRESFSELLDDICINALMLGVLKNIPYIVASQPRVLDYINPVAIPRPKKKEELRILLLADSCINTAVSSQINKLGLNVGVFDDGNTAIDKFVKNHLGDYDIILGSSTYSSLLTDLAIESTEQCKDTGRELVMLATYEEELNPLIDENFNFGELNTFMKLQYVFAGLSKDASSLECLSFKMPGDDEKMSTALLEVAVDVYSRQLGYSLSDNSSQHVFAEKLESFEDETENLKMIESFDNFIKAIKYLTRGSRKNVLYQNELSVKKTALGLRIEYSNLSRPVCALTVSLKPSEQSIRVFYLEMFGKKNRLATTPISLGYYTSLFDRCKSVPPRPNSEQQRVIDGLFKKVLGIEDKTREKNRESTFKKLEMTPK